MSWWSDIKTAVAFAWSPGRKTLLHRRSGSRVAVGNQGEALAVAFLKRAGFRIVEANVAMRFGEIDIVAESPQGAVVFVEVKAGKFHPKYPPELHVNAAKRRKLVRLGHAYLKLRGRVGEPHRFDVVAVVFHEDGRAPEIRHHENAIRRGR